MPPPSAPRRRGPALPCGDLAPPTSSNATGGSMADGKGVLVVTGAGGMGVAVVRRLGAGRKVVLAECDDARRAQTAHTLRDDGYDVDDHDTDVSSRADVDELADVAAQLGPIRAVVHTAGVSPVSATPETIVAVDVIGTARILDAFERHVQEGTVAVCIASMAGTMMELPPDMLRAFATTPTEQLASLPALDPATLDSGSAYAIGKRA